MVGAGIFALLGQAAVIAGSAVWLSFLLAGLVTLLLAYNVVKLGIRYPSEGGLIEYLRQGFGNGRLLGIASWLGLRRRLRGRRRDARRLLRELRDHAVRRRRRVERLGQPVRVAADRGDDRWSTWSGRRSSRGSRPLMVVVLLAVFAVFIVVTISDVDFDLLAFSGYPSFSKIIASIALTFFAFLGFGVMTFTVGKPPRPRARAAEGGGARARADDGHLRADLDRRLRDAHGRRGDRLRRDGDRRGGAADPRRRRLHADGGRRADRDGRRDERDALRRGGPDGLAGGARAVSSAARPALAARQARRPARHRDPRARARELRRPLRDRLGRQRLLARRLPARRARRLPAAVGDGRLGAVVLLGMAATAVVLGFFAVDTLRNAPETFAAIVAMTLLAVVLDLVWKRVREDPAIPSPSQPGSSV